MTAELPRVEQDEELVEDRDIPFRMSCSYLEMSSNIRQKISQCRQRMICLMNRGSQKGHSRIYQRSCFKVNMKLYG